MLHLTNARSLNKEDNTMKQLIQKVLPVMGFALLWQYVADALKYQGFLSL